MSSTSSVSSWLVRLKLIDEKGWEIRMKASQPLPLKGFVDPSKKDNQRLFSFDHNALLWAPMGSTAKCVHYFLFLITFGSSGDWPKKKVSGRYLSLKLLMEMSRTSPGFPRKIKVHPWLFKLKELELITPVRLSLALNSCTHWLVGSLLLLIPPEFIGFLPPRLRVVRWLPSKKWTFYWSLCEGHYSKSCFFPR